MSVCVYVYVPHLLYSFIFWWTFRLFPCLSYCKYCCSEHWVHVSFQIIVLSRYMPGVELYVALPLLANFLIPLYSSICKMDLYGVALEDYMQLYSTNCYSLKFSIISKRKLTRMNEALWAHVNIITIDLSLIFFFLLWNIHILISPSLSTVSGIL